MVINRTFRALLLFGTMALTGACLLASPLTSSTSATTLHDDGSGHTDARRSFQFEVVSIHHHRPGAEFLNRQLTPDGFRASMSVWEMIMTAYNPQSSYYWPWSHIAHAPPWLKDMYDINARISQEDIADWQRSLSNDQFFKDKSLERSAFKAILEQRFALNLHVAPVEVPWLNLVVAPRGIHLTQYTPGAIKPIAPKSMRLGEGFFFEDGGERHFAGVTMAELALLLSQLSHDYPVQDKTGIIGRYDFGLRWYDYDHFPDSEFIDSRDRLSLSTIGLRLERGKGPGFNFDILHIAKLDDN